MSNPKRILHELDRHLDHPVRLILFGRSALSLGYSNSPVEFEATLDVDAILPEREMEIYERDDQFWDALEKTNEALESEGFYITHLFSDEQVILSPVWLEDIVEILGPWKNLMLFRPATTDLILTKMMRVDPQDWEDIRFLLSRTTQDEQAVLENKIESAAVPDVPEILEAFLQVKEQLRAYLSEREEGFGLGS